MTDLKAYDREVRLAGFIVLMNVGMPSVLVEVGFITNSLDLRILTSESGQNRIAQSIFKAFVNYKSEMDRNSVILNQEKVKKIGNEFYYAVQIASSKTQIKNVKNVSAKFTF